jgi:hypothetical protein
MGKTFCNEGVSHEEGGEKLEEVQNLSLSLAQWYLLEPMENAIKSGGQFFAYITWAK